MKEKQRTKSYLKAQTELFVYIYPDIWPVILLLERDKCHVDVFVVKLQFFCSKNLEIKIST